MDYGDLSVVPGYIEETYARIETALSPLVEAGMIPVMMGGDHSITLPELRLSPGSMVRLPWFTLIRTPIPTINISENPIIMSPRFEGRLKKILFFPSIRFKWGCAARLTQKMPTMIQCL